MTHDELLADIKEQIEVRKELGLGDIAWSWNALRAVVELHKPEMYEGRFSTYPVCHKCVDEGGYTEPYPCPTIQAIEKELQ